MTVRKSTSNPALDTVAEDSPSGPLSGPSTTEWRRQRLLQIGNNLSATSGPELVPDESSSLRPALEARAASYGTVPASSRAQSGNGKQKSTFRSRHALGALPSLFIPKSRDTIPPTPGSHTPRSLNFRNTSYFASQRPISAYDKPVVEQDDDEPEGAVKTNGVRVWYSSFTSIDWLHDAIKDSARQAALRRRRSRRGKIRRQLDRSIGWLTVTIIGLLTAVVAFLIIRSEQWLFDIKEGYCTAGLWRAKRFCCPGEDDVLLRSAPSFVTVAVSEDCVAWRPWGVYFAPVASAGWLEVEAIEYTVYTIIAVRHRHTTSVKCLLFAEATSDLARCHLLASDALPHCFNIVYHAKGLGCALVYFRKRRRYQSRGTGSQSQGSLLRK